MRYALTSTLVLPVAWDLALASDESASRLVESPLSTANLLQTAGGLLLVVGVMLVLAWLVKRYVQLPGQGKGQVQILGGVSLGARERAVLLSVDGRRLLVGVAPGRVQTLLDLSGSSGPITSFGDRLDRASTAIDGRRPEADS